MTRKTYHPDQMEEGILRASMLEDPRLSHSHHDDMVYANSAAVIWATEGTFSAPAALGGVIRYASGAVAGNRARLGSVVVGLIFNPAKDLLLIYRTQTAEVVQVSKFIGLFDALPTAAAPSVEPANGIYFRALDAAGAVNYFAVCRAASVETAVDTGVLDSAAFRDFKIVKKGAAVQFWIDGVLKATITTNIPAVNLLDATVAVTQAAVAKNLDIDTRTHWAPR